MQGADRIALAQTVAVDKLLEGSLVGAVVRGGKERVILVQGAVVEDSLMYGAGRDEDKPLDARGPGSLDELDRPDDVLLDEFAQLSLAPAEAPAGMVQGSMNDGGAVLDQPAGRLAIAQLARQPFQASACVVDFVAIAGSAVPAAAVMAALQQQRDDVTPQKAGGAGYSDAHGLLTSAGRRPTGSAGQAAEGIEDFLIFGKPPGLVFAVNQLAVRLYVEDAASSLDEPRLDAQFPLDGGPQTGGLGKVVSLHAVGDADLHGRSFSASCR